MNKDDQKEDLANTKIEEQPTAVVQETVKEDITRKNVKISNTSDRFYSPLVKSMALKEGIEMPDTRFSNSSLRSQWAI